MDSDTHTDTYRENIMWRWRQRSGWLIYKPRSTNHCSWPPEAEREAQDRVNSQKDPPLLTGWSWIPASRTLREDTFCCLSHPVSGTLLWQPRKVNKLSKEVTKWWPSHIHEAYFLFWKALSQHLWICRSHIIFSFPWKISNSGHSDSKNQKKIFHLGHSCLVTARWTESPLVGHRSYSQLSACWRTCVI